MGIRISRHISFVKGLRLNYFSLQHITMETWRRYVYDSQRRASRDLDDVTLIYIFRLCFCMQSMEVLLQMGPSADSALDIETELLSTSSGSSSSQVLFLPLKHALILLYKRIQRVSQVKPHSRHNENTQKI